MLDDTEGKGRSKRILERGKYDQNAYVKFSKSYVWIIATESELRQNNSLFMNSLVISCKSSRIFPGFVFQCFKEMCVLNLYIFIAFWYKREFWGPNSDIV